MVGKGDGWFDVTPVVNEREEKEREGLLDIVFKNLRKVGLMTWMDVFLWYQEEKYDGKRLLAPSWNKKWPRKMGTPESWYSIFFFACVTEELFFISIRHVACMGNHSIIRAMQKGNPSKREKRGGREKKKKRIERVTHPITLQEQLYWFHYEK